MGTLMAVAADVERTVMREIGVASFLPPGDHWYRFTFSLGGVKKEGTDTNFPLHFVQSAFLVVS